MVSLILLPLLMLPKLLLKACSELNPYFMYWQPYKTAGFASVNPIAIAKCKMPINQMKKQQHNILLLHGYSL